MSRRTAAILLFLFWGLAFWATHTPIHGGGWLKEWLEGLPVQPDKLVHAGIYFCLAGLMANFVGRWTRSKRILAPLTFLITLSYGAIDEGLQAFVPTRTPDFYDLVADAIGAFLGTTVFIGLRSGKARLTASQASAEDLSVVATKPSDA